MARISSHRVAILNAERKVTGLITQSMVISLLDQHMDRLGALAQAHTVDEMCPGQCAGRGDRSWLRGRSVRAWQSAGWL